MDQQGIVCPECRTLNEAGWSFCQQCGKRLPKDQPAPQPTADVTPPPGLKTVPDQQAATEADVAKGLKTVWEKPLDHGLTTVAEESSSVEPEVRIQPEGSDEKHRPAEASGIAPASSTDTPTVVVDAAPLPKPAAPAQVEAGEIPSTPPPSIGASDQKTEHVHAVSGVLCTQCGQANNVGSAFCASCGAPVTFGKTMVMSSQIAPVKGRLHLVMEGGQPGEVYDLGTETVIGRSGGDISFPHDGFMSGRHARIIERNGTFLLVDEGSRNGTFIKIKGEVELKKGDMILVGKQLFRFEV